VTLTQPKPDAAQSLRPARKPATATATSASGPFTSESREHVAGRYVWAVTRIALGFIFLWAFLDKLIGLDHATPSARSWLNGGSPTNGFLSGVEGPFAGVFNAMAGATWADWLFMIALLAIGLALALGIGMRIAAVSGGLLLVFMWAASLPITTNPFLDDHLVYAMVLVGLALSHAGDTVGFGHRWSQMDIVKRFPVLI
jgi:thiosulfate dehydrogenase [quinone] large subunit